MTPQQIMELVAKYWGWEVGNLVKSHVESVIGATNVSVDELKNAIATIQSILDADPNTPEFDVAQNIISTLNDHLTRIQNIENQIQVIRGDENVPGSIANAVKAERDRALAAEANLQQQISANSAAIGNLDGAVSDRIAQAIDSARNEWESADANLQAQINDIRGGNSGLSLEGINSKVEAIRAAAGLDENGNYVANTGAHYIDGATSLKNADDILDAAIKSVEDRVAAVEQSSQDGLSGLDQRVGTLEQEVGTLTGDENVQGSVANQVKAGVDDAKAYADAVAQQKANEAEANAKAYADQTFVKQTDIASINAQLLANIFRCAAEAALNSIAQEDVISGTYDCSGAQGNAGGNDPQGDGTVI